MDEKRVQVPVKFTGQRWVPIKPKMKSPAEAARMALEYDIMKRAQYKEEAIEMLETMSQEAPLHVTSMGKFSEGFVREMFSKMVCQWCNFIPSPYRRYICPDGHLFCTPCGQERCIKHGGKCMIESRQALTELNYAKIEAEGGSSSTFPVSLKRNSDHWIDGSNHFPVCQQKIRLYAGDPVFTSLWVCAVWKCPGGCNEAFEGRNLLQHLQHCIQDKTSQLDEESDAMSEDNSVALVSEPEKEYPILTLSKVVECIVSGCSQQILFRNVIEHVILNHGIYAMDAGDEDLRTSHKTGLLYVPQSAIEARRPFYTLIRYRRRFFLFCMEPSDQNSYDVGFWIRRISNSENKEEENGPYVKYNLSVTDKFRDMQVLYNNSCIPWRKPSSEVLEEMQCMTLPISLLLGRLVRICEDKDCDVIDEDDEKGYLPMNFRILVENVVGALYFDEINEPGTSSMESLAIVSTTSVSAIGASEGSEVTNEESSKVSSDSEDVDVDEYVEESHEDEKFSFTEGGIAGSNHKINIWFEKIYKDELFSCQYSP